MQQQRMAGFVALFIGIGFAGATAFGVVTAVAGDPEERSQQQVEQDVLNYGTNQTSN